MISTSPFFNGAWSFSCHKVPDSRIILSHYCCLLINTNNTLQQEQLVRRITHTNKTIFFKVEIRRDMQFILIEMLILDIHILNTMQASQTIKHDISYTNGVVLNTNFLKIHSVWEISIDILGSITFSLKNISKYLNP